MPRQPLPRNAKSADARLIYSLIKTGSYVDLDEFKRQLPRSASSVDEKKKQTTKGKTDKKPRRPYATMIMAALRSLQTASAGTGFLSIAKYINANFDVPDNYKGYVKAALRRMVHKGRLQKIKGMYRSKKIRVPKAAAQPTKKNHKVPKKKPLSLPKKPISAPSVTISRPRSTSTSLSVSLPLKKSDAPKISPAGYHYHWQFLGRQTGWHDYELNGSDVIEQAYQTYLQNPGMCDVRAVQSGQWMYQVDFVNMKQTNTQHQDHTTRQIRRLPFVQ